MYTQVKTGVNFVLDQAEDFVSLQAKLSVLQAEDMVDILSNCSSSDDIETMLQIIYLEYQKKRDFEDAKSIFEEMSLIDISKEDLALICALLREFSFEGTLLATLENKPERSIKILRVNNYSKDRDIIIQLDWESSSPWFYLEGQIFLQMNEISISWEEASNVKYYKWITFWGKKWILTVSGYSTHTQVLDTTHSINAHSVVILKNSFEWWFHLYLPDKSLIMHLYAAIVWTYFQDKNGYKIDESDEEYEEKISDPWIKKIMRLILDVEKWYFYDFDGEDFWSLKIQTDNLILGHQAKKKLH